MLVLVIQHHPHRTFADLRRKLVRCLARHGSTFSGVGASDKPGAVQFGILALIVVELGLIHPPVGLNLFVIKNIAPDIPLRDVIWGVLPFVALMIFAVVVLCIFPGIATWLADAVMGR